MKRTISSALLPQPCTRAGEECVIATGDRDSLQLVGPHVSVRLAFTKAGQPQAVLYDEEKIREEYGVSPPQLLDIKALMGDSSDNIPGVAGIGQKGGRVAHPDLRQHPADLRSSSTNWI